jgi:hypothetical protein
MHTGIPAPIHSTLQAVTDAECEQIGGGLDYGALITLGIEVLEIVMTCAIAGVSCFA